MKADEFSVWFSGVRRPVSGRRREVAAALANLDGGLWRGGRDGDSPRPAGRGTKARAGSSSRCFGNERP